MTNSLDEARRICFTHSSLATGLGRHEGRAHHAKGYRDTEVQKLLRRTGRRRWTQTLAALLAIGLVLSAAPALADTSPSSTRSEHEALDASGCTLAPGVGAGSQQCIEVYGDHAYVHDTDTIYRPGVSPWPPNICNRYGGWKFKRAGSSSYTLRTQGPYGCIPGVLPSSHQWYARANFADNSSFCARSKNSHTNNAWTTYACITIEA